MLVQPIDDCRLTVSETPWRFAYINSLAIADHWTAAVQANPKHFNGDVFVVSQWCLKDGVLEGTSHRTKFAAYNYWRAVGDGLGTEEAFATTVVCGSDGGILLARAVAGTLNAGRYVSPGGLFDNRDVDDNGLIDVAGAAARELEEETGLAASAMSRDSGFLVAYSAPYIGVASVFRSALDSAQLLNSVERFLEMQSAPELESPRMIYHPGALEEIEMTPHARLLSAYVLGEGTVTRCC